MTVHKNKKNNIDNELVGVGGEGGEGQTAKKNQVVGSLAELVCSQQVIRTNRRIHIFRSKD